MSALELKIPPLVLLGMFAAFNALIATLMPPFAALTLQLQLAALLLLVVAAVFCLAGVISFRLARTTVDPRKPLQSAALVSSGIYRITRNPMYVGFSLMLLAQSVYLHSLIGLIVTVLFMAYLQRFQIIPEERALYGLFGAAYSGYCQRVRRWL